MHHHINDLFRREIVDDILNQIPELICQLVVKLRLCISCSGIAMAFHECVCDQIASVINHDIVSL